MKLVQYSCGCIGLADIFERSHDGDKGWHNGIKLMDCRDMEICFEPYDSNTKQDFALKTWETLPEEAADNLLTQVSTLIDKGHKWHDLVDMFKGEV